MPLFSIITVTYNAAGSLRRTLSSVSSQTFRDVEHIFIDGVSTDGTLNILSDYRSRYGSDYAISVFFEPDNGLYDAMNKGVKMATGDVIGMLNSDDFYFDNGVLKKIADAVETYRVDCVFGDLLFVDANDTHIVKRVWKGSPYKDGTFRKGWVPAHPTFYARKSCFDKYGVFNLDYQVSADFDLMLRFLEVNKATSYYVPSYFVKMRMGGESTGNVKNIIRGNKNVVRILRANGINVTWLYPIRRIAPKVMDVVVRKFRLKKTDKK